MVDSSNGAHGSFFDPFSVSSFGFFNSKDPGSNLPPILSNVSNSPTFNGLGGLGGGLISNGLCGLLNQPQSQSHCMQNGGLGQLTGFGQGNKSPTYNNSQSPLFGGGPSSPTSFFGSVGNSNQFSYNCNKQFPITTFNIEDTIQGRSSNNESIFNGRNGGGCGDAPIFNRSSSFNDSSVSSSMFGRNTDTSMFSRSSSINESPSMYNNRSNMNGDSGMFSNSRSTTNDNSVFNSMDDLNISAWNGPFTSGNGNTTNNYCNNRDSSSSNFMSNSNNLTSQRERDGGVGSSSGTSTGDGVNQGVRETGIIEKLLHSYGFIQCCERQARLFFHFSQFEGTIEHLKLGDPVEFEMTYDRRTGKPIASFVTKIGPEVVLSEERVNGTVTTELHHESSGELQGRISYENRGECFFLPYCLEDIEGNVSLAVGDAVSFQIATNQRSGNLTARYVRLENPAQPVRYRGIVSSIKDNFGFIERADVAKELFFHFSETRVHEGIVVGDNIEFNIQTRNGKEVASSISKLPFGTVVFEDIGVDVLKGQVLKPVDRSQPIQMSTVPVPRSETMQGRLRYRGPDRQELEVIYGEKDQKGSFSMRHGDWVEFQLAVDRRDKQQRATNIRLLEESFLVSGERREEGVISAIKDGSGLITCAERDQKVSFNITEFLDFNRIPKVADDVEFTIVPDPSSQVRQSATRVNYLAPGTVQFEIPLSKRVPGIVVSEPSTTWVSQEALAGIIPSLANLGLPATVTEKLIQNLSTSNDLMRKMNGTTPESQGEPGIISYQLNGINGWQTENIVFHWKDCKQLQNVRVGSHVIFDIHQVRRTREIIAANIESNNQEKSETPNELPFDTPVVVASTNSSCLPISKDQDFPSENHITEREGEFHSNFPPLEVQQPIGTSPVSSDSQQLLERQPSISSSTPPSSGSSGCSVKGSSNSLVEDFEPSLRRYSPDSDKSDSPAGSYGSNYRTNSVSEMNGTTTRGPRFVMRGYIAALKDGFGFIETAAQDGEIFFHSSSLVGDFSLLDVGQEVEYVISSKASISGKNAADMVKPLPRGTITRPEIYPEILQGIVVRPVRGANPDQSEYMGLVEDLQGRGYPFGITSMLNKKEILQVNEVVEFQVDAESNAVNIRALRKKLRATVEAVKGLYGFLSYELEDGKKLFFHMSEVKDNLHLNPGDEVEFVILQNPRNGKSSACSVVKLSETQRPERLLNRLSKLSVDETVPRLIVIRQPYGPDGSSGFNHVRTPKIPGVL